MKISRPIVWIVCAGGLAAWALMVGAWSWGIRGEAETRLGRAMALEARGRTLRAETEAACLRAGELTATLQDLSNRVAEVTAQLEEEKKTHDPLRRQIEQMLAEQVRSRDKARQRDNSFAEMETTLAALRKTNEVFRAQSGELRKRMDVLEAQAKEASERETALQARLEEARGEAARNKAQWEETARKLEETTRLLEEARKAAEKPEREVPAPREGGTPTASGP